MHVLAELVGNNNNKKGKRKVILTKGKEIEKEILNSGKIIRKLK